MFTAKESRSASDVEGIDALELEIVRRAQRGERRAFDLLVIRYQGRILSVLNRYTRNSADAEDAAQETFLKAYRGLKQFRCESAFYTWLHRIALNCAKSLLKTRACAFAGPTWDVLARSDDMSELPSQLRDAATPDQVTCAGEMRDLIDSTLSSLPPGHRTAIMLREVDGISYAAIAAAMHVPIGTVRSRIFRAREVLDKQLRQLVDGGLGRCLPQPKSAAAVKIRPAA